MQWPDTRLVLFGSSGNNLCTKGSDLDLCLHVPLERLHPNEAQHRRGAAGGRDRERQQKQRQRKNLDQFLLKLAVLLRNGGMLDVEPITTARVPIVKFKVRDGIASTLECDLCINNVLACHNTELIYAFTMLDWRVRPLVYCIKLW
jgi:terminal uridylyltransferase